MDNKDAVSALLAFSAPASAQSPDKRRRAPTRRPRSSGTAATSRGKRKKAWSSEEDECLRRGVAALGSENRWKRISEEYLDGRRSDVECLHRHANMMQGTATIKGSWTPEEDALILKLVSESKGPPSWAAIAKQLPGRIGKQCRERWVNHLDPTLKHTPFTAEEDAQLCKLHDELGNKWAVIARKLPGRSDNAVKNRWYSKFGTSARRERAASAGGSRGSRGKPAERRGTPTRLRGLGTAASKGGQRKRRAPSSGGGGASPASSTGPPRDAFRAPPHSHAMGAMGASLPLTNGMGTPMNMAYMAGHTNGLMGGLMPYPGMAHGGGGGGLPLSLGGPHGHAGAGGMHGMGMATMHPHVGMGADMTAGSPGSVSVPGMRSRLAAGSGGIGLPHTTYGVSAGAFVAHPGHSVGLASAGSAPPAPPAHTAGAGAESRRRGVKRPRDLTVATSPRGTTAAGAAAGQASGPASVGSADVDAGSVASSTRRRGSRAHSDSMAAAEEAAAALASLEATPRGPHAGGGDDSGSAHTAPDSGLDRLAASAHAVEALDSASRGRGGFVPSGLNAASVAALHMHLAGGGAAGGIGFGAHAAGTRASTSAVGSNGRPPLPTAALGKGGSVAGPSVGSALQHPSSAAAGSGGSVRSEGRQPGPLLSLMFHDSADLRLPHPATMSAVDYMGNAPRLPATA